MVVTKLINRKKQLFHLALEEVDSPINERMGFTLTEIIYYMPSLNKDPENLILLNSF